MTAISEPLAATGNEANICLLSETPNTILQKPEKSLLRMGFDRAVGAFNSGLSFVKSKLREAFQVAKDNPILTMSAFVAADMLLLGGGHTQSMLLAAGSAVIGALTQSALNAENAMPGSLYGASCELPYAREAYAPQPA